LGGRGKAEQVIVKRLGESLAAPEQEGLMTFQEIGIRLGDVKEPVEVVIYLANLVVRPFCARGYLFPIFRHARSICSYF
jgi:hypothetical protein